MASAALRLSRVRASGRFALLPGLALCLAVTAVAYALEAGERALFGKAWIEALVLAIVAGMAVRSYWAPGPRWHAGIAFSAKYLLEIAVVLLGLSVSAATLLGVGGLLLAGIAAVVAAAVPAGFVIGRLLGLPARMALLVACGNAICGNSAIAAVAPVIGADAEDVAASIAFTAVLGVAVVLGLPVFGHLIGMRGAAYGAFAGLTVYAVPQVIAAAAPMGITATQTGTLVKLMRVLMLGPVCLVLSLIAPRLPRIIEPEDAVVTGEGPVRRHLSLGHLVPWFILGFIAMAACHSLNLIPAVLIAPAGEAATGLTIVSMAALGLGVDIRTVASASGRVTAAVILSLAAIGTISFALLASLGWV